MPFLKKLRCKLIIISGKEKQKIKIKQNIMPVFIVGICWKALVASNFSELIGKVIKSPNVPKLSKKN